MEHVGNDAKIRVAMLLLFCVILKISVQVTIKFSLSHAVYHSKTFNLSQTSQTEHNFVCSELLQVCGFVISAFLSIL